MKSWIWSAALLAAALGLTSVAAIAQSTATLEGRWEGPWYRGMSSGRATLTISADAGTLQLTNSETFGSVPQPLDKLAVDGKSVQLRAVGESGAALTVDLTLNAKGDQLKGMGKYEGFGVRLELRRTGG